MDKRTISLTILLFITLFSVNLYFERRNEQKRQEWIAQQEIKKQKLQQYEQHEIEEKIAPIADLPLANIFLDTDQNRFISQGVLSKNHLITLSWTENLPKTVYVSQENGEDPEKYTLRVDGLKGQPILYQKGEKPFLIADIPSFGRYDLQLLFFKPEQKLSNTDLALGQFTEREFSPLGNIPPGNAIALLSTSEGFLPAGFYDQNNQTFNELEEISGFAFISQKFQDKEIKTGEKQEEFYVLENEYQQFVFSNFGAALSEINLPFKMAENSSSVVREIGFDREMVQEHPNNARFPSHPYYIPGSNPKNGFKFIEEGKLGGYYPLLRRDLVTNGNDTIDVNPQYYALNLASEFPDLSNLVYNVTYFDKNTITFEGRQKHRKITKTFSIAQDNPRGPYILDMSIKVEGDNRGLWLTSGIPEVELISGNPAPNLKYRITRNQKAEVLLIDLPKEAVTVTSVNPDWISNSNGFLGMIMDPLSKIDPGYRVEKVSGVVVPSRLILLGNFKAENLPGYMTYLPLKQSNGELRYRFFAGPFDGQILAAIDKTYTNPETGENPDFAATQTFHGWFAFISEPFAKFLFFLMQFFHQITGSWAFSIILLTIALRIMLYPLNAWSTKSMLKMQQIGPDVAAIQEKYKKDPKRAQLEIMSLYRERGVNPLSGCLPLIIQMPFLIGMFDLLKSSFALRGAPFIPGWIDDLTAPDVLFRWKTPIFFIGNEFHLLPILLGIVMFLQQRFMSPQVDPSLMTEQQKQQRAMGSIMAVVFALMFYHFPSGLNIYWLSSMLLGIVQQWYTSKQMKNKVSTNIVEIKPKKK